MSDFLVNLGTKPLARKGIKKLGLPIPLPQKLERPGKPWEERPLEGETAIVCHSAGKKFASMIAGTLAKAGADCLVIGNDRDSKPYKDNGRAWGRQALKLDDNQIPDDVKPKYLLFDASGLKKPSDLKKMYRFFHNWVRRLAPCGRAVVLAGPPGEAKKPSGAACFQAVDGFVRSMAREVGRKGATAQVLYVEEGAKEHAKGALWFLLSQRSSYISAQPFRISTMVDLKEKPPFVRPLDGKIALVTGAARGIGASIALAFAREGAHVIGMDRPSENDLLSKLMDKINGTMLLCDITDKDGPEKIFKEIKKEFKGLDIIVHNAGVTRDKMLANMDEQRWDMTLGVNLVSLINVNEKIKTLLRENGRVVCLASIGGIAGNMGQTNYAASKAGVIGYVRALAPTMAHKNITVNAVAPGFIETQMTAAIPLTTREVARRLCNLSQGGRPEDIGELVTFLASPGSCGISGEVIRICGGNYVGA